MDLAYGDCADGARFLNVAGELSLTDNAEAADRKGPIYPGANVQAANRLDDVIAFARA